MNGISRGQVLWTILGGSVVQVTVLDRGPDGWWCKADHLRDAFQVKPAALYGLRQHATKAASS